MILGDAAANDPRRSRLAKNSWVRSLASCSAWSRRRISAYTGYQYERHSCLAGGRPVLPWPMRCSAEGRSTTERWRFACRDSVGVQDPGHGIATGPRGPLRAQKKPTRKAPGQIGADAAGEPWSGTEHGQPSASGAFPPRSRDSWGNRELPARSEDMFDDPASAGHVLRDESAVALGGVLLAAKQTAGRGKPQQPKPWGRIAGVEQPVQVLGGE